jgi:hypothetical protein
VERQSNFQPSQIPGQVATGIVNAPGAIADGVVRAPGVIADGVVHAPENIANGVRQAPDAIADGIEQVSILINSISDDRVSDQLPILKNNE